MTNPMLAELDAVVRLMEAATEGEWGSWHLPASGTSGDAFGHLIGPPIRYRDRSQGFTPDDAHLIARSVNFLRTHHATLADMAKRLEAAERDAKDAVCVTKAQKIVRDIWETWYPGNEWTPASTTLDLLHQIGNSLLGVPEFERVADSRLRAQNAIAATQEGEG